MRWFSLGTDLFLIGFAVWQLPIAYSGRQAPGAGR
jgi:hypothetical protein